MCHHKVLASIRCVGEERKDGKDMAADTFVELNKIYDEGRRDTTETHHAKWGDLRKRAASLTKALVSKSLELHTMSGLATGAVQLRMKLYEARKEIECRAAKLAASKEVEVEITSIKRKVTKLLSSMKMLREYRLAESAKACQREVKIQLLREREKSSNRNLASVKEKLANVKGVNIFFRWCRKKVDDEVTAPEAEVGSALKTVAVSAQLKKMQVSQLVDAAFFQHWKPLMEHVCWTMRRIANYLKGSPTRADLGIHGAIAKCVAILSSQLRTVKAAGAEGAPLTKVKNRNVTSDGSVGRSGGSGADPSNVGCPSS